MISGRPTLREFFAQRGMPIREVRDGSGKLLDPDKLIYRGQFVDGPDGKMQEVNNARINETQ